MKELGHKGGDNRAMNNSHDLNDFFRSASEELEAEYKRIERRSTEDPGTAGDEGEENWADILRN